MYKLDKKSNRIHNFKDADKLNVFHADVPLKERLQQSWYLTCFAFGIDPASPPKMIKNLTGTRKHLR